MDQEEQLTRVAQMIFEKIEEFRGHTLDEVKNFIRWHIENITVKSS